MESTRGRRASRHSLQMTALLCCLWFCFFVLAFVMGDRINGTICFDTTSSRMESCAHQGTSGTPSGSAGEARAAARRRNLGGPGSYPPRCAGKCGKCTPCKPVHVPVPPGTPVTTEYYPEAWRCKCGNRLYMP